jgi:hypothetical protein
LKFKSINDSGPEAPQKKHEAIEMGDWVCVLKA